MKRNAVRWLTWLILLTMGLSLLALPAAAAGEMEGALIEETVSEAAVEAKAGETPLVNVIEPEDPADPAAVGEEPMEAAPEEDLPAEPEAADEPAEETAEPAEEVTEPVEETAEPADETTVPAEETTTEPDPGIPEIAPEEETVTEASGEAVEPLETDGAAEHTVS